MVITKDRIWAQIQQDSAAYDAFSDDLKEVLLKEVELARNSFSRADRETKMTYSMARSRVI
jgi:hypothetical protein